MSNLQVLARRCPVMGKAITVQSARSGGARGIHTKGKSVKMFHSGGAKPAQAVDVNVVKKQAGKFLSQFGELQLIEWK
jgi:5-aminolevulinate synthase